MLKLPVRGKPNLLRDARRALSARLTHAHAELRSGSSFNADTVEELERLAKVVEIESQAALRRARFRFVVVPVLFLCSVIIAAAYVRRPRVAVEGTLVLTDVQLTLPRPQILPWRGPVAYLRASGVHGLRFITGAPPDQNFASPRQIFVNSATGGVTLNQLVTNGRTQLGIHWSPDPTEYNVNFRCLETRCSPGTLQLTLRQPASVSVGAIASRPLQPYEGPLHFVAGANAASAEFALRDSSMLILEALRVDSIKFSRIELVASGIRVGNVQRSNVRRGELILDGVAEKRVKLGDRQILSIDADSFVITSAKLTPEGVELRFTVSARSATVSGAHGLEELKPSWLMWLASQDVFTTSRIAVFFGVVVILGIVRWVYS